MAVSLRQFAENLAKSGLFSAEELAAFQESLPPETRPKDAQSLARALNQAGKLTKYQASAVYQGKTRGLVFDEYVVLDAIGAGGMGEVFKARHRTMERVVALKMLPRRAMKSPDAVERFHREVRAAAKLTHPNIVTAHDAREHEGIHCLVMEYVDGKDLANVLADEGPLPVDRAVDYVSQAAKGLEYAHKQGVIHRDIKPGNLLLDREGTVKILDMGLARVGATDTPTDAKGAEPLTASGQMMGTWDYMAPEQAADTRGADHRADVYSLGCTLYRLLAGKPPYSGETAIQTLLAHQQAPIPSLSEARPDVPQELDAVFRKMMAKELEDRYQSMGDVVADLEACLPGDELPAPLSGGRAVESSTDSKLTAFFRTLAQGGVASKRKATRVAEETVQRGPEQETNVVAGEEAAPLPARPNKLVLISAAGIATGVVVILGLFLTLGGSGDEAEKKQVEAATETDQRQTNDEQPLGELAARTPTADLKETEPETAEWQTAWDETETEAKALIAEERFAEAERLYSALGERHEAPQLDGQINDAVAAIQGQARTAYEQAQAQAKQLTGKKEYAEARKALDGVLNRHGIPANVEAAKRVLAEIDAIEKQAQAQAAAEQAEEGRMAEIEKRQQVEQRYTEAMKPVEELVAAWDFRGALAALSEVQFEEEELAARLAAWRAGVARLVELKVRIIAAINNADPPLKSTALLIRGAGRNLTGADDEGVSAELRSGKTEPIAWANVGPQALGKLIELAGASDRGDDHVAAGVLALASQDSTAAERHLEEAQSLGAEIGPYLAPLAAAALGQAEQLVGAEEFSEAEALLTSLEAKYADTAWFVSNRATFEAVRTETQQGIFESEAEKLYAEAAKLFEKERLFDVKPLVEKLKSDYADSKPVTDAARKPSLSEMQEGVGDLGRFITVRQDGKGDFTGIQEAIDAASPNSLIEVQDNGPYNEKIVISKEGLTLRGMTGSWPVITSTGPLTNFPTLLAVQQEEAALERLVLAHGGAAGNSAACLANLSGGLRVRQCVIYGLAAMAFDNVKGSATVDLCVAAGKRGHAGESLAIKNSIWLSEVNWIYEPCRIENTVLRLPPNGFGPGGRVELYGCTVLPRLFLPGGENVVVDCIVHSIESPKDGNRIEHCNVWSAPTFIDLARPGKGCVSAKPTFVNPEMLDYRWMPSSPYSGKASDGGDIGCRYTPEMIEMVQTALELRAQGIVKF